MAQGQNRGVPPPMHDDDGGFDDDGRFSDYDHHPIDNEIYGDR